MWCSQNVRALPPFAGTINALIPWDDQIIWTVPQATNRFYHCHSYSRSPNRPTLKRAMENSRSQKRRLRWVALDLIKSRPVPPQARKSSLVRFNHMFTITVRYSKAWGICRRTLRRRGCCLIRCQALRAVQSRHSHPQNAACAQQQATPSIHVEQFSATSYKLSCE